MACIRTPLRASIVACFVAGSSTVMPGAVDAEEPARSVAQPARGEPVSQEESNEIHTRCIDESDGTNPAWGQCGGELVKRADERLNAAWRRATAELTPDGKAALLDEQRAWLVWRDKSCQVYDNGEFGREGQVLSFPICRAGEIDRRTDQLNAYANRDQ